MNVTIDTILNSDIRICQPADGFRFSVDPVLLSRFVQVKKPKRVIDVGSGSGIIATLLAKLYGYLHIDAVEVQPDMVGCLKETVLKNELQSQVFPIQADIRGFKPDDRYDVVVCNPPYWDSASGRNSQTDNKQTAKFADEMNLENLFQFAKSHLHHLGYCYFSYDAALMGDAVNLARGYGLEPKRIQFFHGSANKPARLMLMECRKGAGVEMKIEPPIVQFQDGVETEAYQELMKF